MFFDRKTILTICWLVVTLAEASGKNGRNYRSSNHQLYQPSSRLNSIHFEDRDHNRRHAESSDLFIEPNYNDRSKDNEISKVLEDEEEKFFQVIMAKDYRVSTPAEIEEFDRIGERMIARANITEDAKRVVRQVKRQRPGFFWTLARVAFETVNETRSAIEQISILVSDTVAPEPTNPRQTGRTNSMNDAATTEPVTTTTDTNSMESTTTEENFRFTQSELQSLIRRNLRGLVRLFNIEWRDALNQSQKNVQEFQRDLSSRIGPFLQDNPDVV